MATIINAIRTVFSAQGAENVEDASNRVGRAQNRLGQASASAGRSFAAQSQGLGGLVAAYAGAAATIFAITEAFNILNKAAQAETIIRGTNTLAAEIGQSGPRILKSIQEITQGQLTLAESAQNVNIALAAGFNTKQIESLTTIATQASRALGRDLTESIQRVTRGAAKLEPELLDELGIFTRIDPAVRAYANSLNVSEASLTNFERRQAFVNAVIEEGNKKFSAINTAAPSAQKSLEQLRAQVTELGTEFLLFINNIAAPFVDFFRNNAGNTLLLFGGILSLVLGKGIALFRDWASSSLESLSGFAAKLAQVAEIVKGNFQNITQAATEAKDAVTARGGLAGTAAGLQAAGLSATDAAQLAGTGNFTTQLRGAGSRQLAQDVAAARQRFLAGGATVGAQREADIATFQRAIANLTAAGRTNTLAYQDAQRALTAYNAAATNASLTTRALTGASIALGVAARAAATGFAILNSALGVIATLVTVGQLIGQIFGFDLLAQFREGLSKTSQQVENLKAGFIGLTTAAAGGAAAITKTFRDLGATDKFIEGLDKFFNDLDKQLENKVRDAISNSTIQGALPEVTEFTGVEAIATATDAAVTELDKLAFAQDRVAELSKQLNNASGDTATQLQIEIAALNVLIERYKLGSDSLQQFIGQVARLTGIDSENIAKIATAQGEIVTRTGNGITILGKFVSTLEGADNTTTKFVEAGFSLQNVLNLANEEFSRGATDSERLSQKLAGANSSFKELRDSGLASADALAAAAAEIENLSNKVRELKLLETILDGIRKAFSSQIAAVETAPFSGFISSTGEVAKNAEEAAANQQQYLKQLIDSTNATAALKDQNIELTAVQQKQIELNATARKALLGQLVQNLQAVQQIIKAEEERTRQLEQQRLLQQAQLDLAFAQASAITRTARRNIVLDTQQRGIDAARTQLDFEKKSFNIAIESQKLSNDLLNIEQQIAVTRSSGGGSAAADKARIDAARAELEVLQASRQITIAERDPSSTQKDIIEARRSLILLEQRIAQQDYENRIAVIKSQGGVSKAQQELDKAKIQQEIDILSAEILFADTQYKRQLELFDKETKLAEDKIKAQQAAIEDQKNILELQKAADLAKIEADKQNAAAQSKIIIDQLQGYKTFASSVEALLGGIDAFVTAIVEVLGFGGVDASALRQELSNLPKNIITDIDGVIQRANSNIQTQNSLYDEQAANVGAIFLINKKSLEDQKAALSEQLTDYQKLRGVQRQGLVDELRGAEENLRTKIAILEKEKELIDVQAQAGGANVAAQLAEAQAQYAIVTEQLNFALQDLSFETDVFRQALLGVKSAFRDTLTNELVNLNNSLFEASDETKSFGERLEESLSNVLRSVQEQFFRKTIAEPVSNFITDSIFSLVGLGGERGIEAAKVDPDGALRVRLADGNPLAEGANKLFEGAANKEGGFFSNLFDGVSNFFSGLFGKNGIVANLFNGIFGSGGLFSSIFSGFGGIFSSIFGGIGSAFGGIFGSIFGAAQGGVVHLAAGGQLRDRVPALLEPGEFVIRKPMARQIGVPALQQMNATGQMPMSAPVINFKNEGTAKSVQTEEPRFDGERYVIDIITRDLANNGPIRRTLRGGDV